MSTAIAGPQRVSPFPAASSPRSMANQLRARVLHRLNTEYKRGALTLREYERELDALREYLPIGEGLEEEGEEDGGQ